MNTQDGILYHSMIIANIGYENFMLFLIAVSLYIPVLMVQRKKLDEKTQNSKCTMTLALDVILHSWMTLVMGYIGYNILTQMLWKDAPRNDTFNAAMGGLFFTYFFSFDTNFKTKLVALTNPLQQLYRPRVKFSSPRSPRSPKLRHF